MKKVLKIVAIISASLLALMLVLSLTLQWMLSEKALTRILNRYAVRFVDADVHFGNIYLSLWKDFPHWSVQLDDVVLTYPADRFAREDSVALSLIRMAGSGKQGYYRAPRRRDHRRAMPLQAHPLPPLRRTGTISGAARSG